MFEDGAPPFALTMEAHPQRRSIVLVATQVVEVSLDIDINTLYTDPAPLEALVQRFGRINRRRKQSGFAPVHVYRQPNDGQGIYDELLVQRTLAILERENQRPLDEAAVGRWLDEIYSGEVAAKWRHDYQHAAREFEAGCIQTLQPFAADKELEMLFYKAFDGLDVLPQGLVDVYQREKETEPILSRELLVSISWRRFHALKSKGLAVPREKDTPPIVMADYSSEMGLVFERG